MSDSRLLAARDDLQTEATVLAGQLTDLSRRAMVYHQVYRCSGGNHVFPLIAAHGALWASGYFRFGLQLAEWLSWQYVGNLQRRRQLQALQDFADTFRDINRRVCIDTWTNWQLTARYGQHPGITELVAPELLIALNRLHQANRDGIELNHDEKLSIFRTHFLHEQQHIVGPALLNAVANFDWPLVRFFALQPRVKFAYFPGRQALWFRNFSDRDERIARGLQAFQLAARVGWKQVESDLARYEILPQEFFSDNAGCFATLRSHLLAST